MADSSPILKIIGVVGLPLCYCWTFQRIGRRNAGNKVMECACIAGGIFMGIFVAMKIPGCPEWVAPWLGFLGLLVGFAMIFFIFKGAFLAIRSKLKSRHVETH